MQHDEQIVGYLADLSGTDMQIWAAEPVVELDDALYVLASTQGDDRNRLVSATWDQPGIHRLPESLQAPSTAGAKVILAGESLVSEAAALLAGSGLADALDGASSTLDSRHRVFIGHERRFEAWIEDALNELGPRMLRASAATTGSAGVALFELYSALAQRDSVNYLAHVAAYYRLRDDAARLRATKVRARLNLDLPDDAVLDRAMERLLQSSQQRRVFEWMKEYTIEQVPLDAQNALDVGPTLVNRDSFNAELVA